MTASTVLEPALTISSTQTATFANPVIDEDFPDPFVLQVGDAYYAYATNANGIDLPVRRSSDLVNWEVLGDAMGPLPKWAKRGFTWAPDIMATDDGYVLYYTARHRRSGQQVIGAAFSRSPEGPFIDFSKAPLIAQHELGGAIDAHAFVDTDGTRYLYWKNDGNSEGQLTYLWVQHLSDDGLSLVGEPTRLIHNDQAWERHLIEAPFVLRRDGTYYLFYSAAHYGDETYCVGYATATCPTGPFEKVGPAPFLFSTGHVAGPGGQGILTDASGTTWMYYHAWTAGQAGYEVGGERSMRLDPLVWNDGRPMILGATTAQQFVPAHPAQPVHQ